MNQRIRIRDVTVLSDDWYLLKKTTFDFRRSDGRWQTLSRETYDRGNGAVVLLVNSERRTLVLTRQFRFPAFVNGLADGMLLEACAGLLDSDDPGLFAGKSRRKPVFGSGRRENFVSCT